MLKFYLLGHFSGFLFHNVLPAIWCRFLKKMTLIQQFEKNIELIPFHPCWEWVGFKNAAGYGRVKMSALGGNRAKGHLAHRVAWLLFKSPIPNGLCVLHRCDNRGCVNPDHLFLGTYQDNCDDMIAKNRQNFVLAKALALRTHCHRGHLYDEKNTIIKSSNYGSRKKRVCKACRDINNKNYRELK